MKQTAVEWFAEQVEQHVLTFGNIQPNVITKLKNLSKAMHKEDIVKAWKSGVDYRDNNGHGSTYLEIELGKQPNNYYNETFNTKEK